MPTADALLVGGILITLLNHCDRVKIACLAQLVNVLAPIMTRTGGPAWRQTIFHPFAAASRHGRGTVLQTKIDAPRYHPKGMKDVPLIDACVVRGDDGGVTAFVLHRDLTNPVDLTLELRSFAALKLAGWDLLHDADLDAVNSEAQPSRITLKPASGATLSDNKLAATLPPASWSVFRLVPG